MAIAGLKRLSLNRNSFIGVKNLFFRNDQEKIDCFIRFIDSFTFTYITLLKVVRFYIEIRALDGGMGSIDLDHQEAVLIRIIKYMRKKREEFLLYHRFHSFREAIAKFHMPLAVVLKEFKNFIDVDLNIGIKSLDRNLILDMYNSDLYLFIKTIIPSITTVVEHFKKISDGYENLDTYLVGVNTMIISETSNKIKKMIDENQRLIHRFLIGDDKLSITQFHIQRNEASLKYLNVDEYCELIFGGETFFGTQLMTFETFQKIIISDSIYLLEKLSYQITLIINNVENSMDYFFQLSNFLEVQLNETYIQLKKIKLDPFENTIENLIESCNLIIKVFTKANELVSTSIEYPEFQFKISPLISPNKLKYNVIKIIYQFFNSILESTQRVDELDRTDQFQHRFKITIDSLSCGVLGLEDSIESFADALEY